MERINQKELYSAVGNNIRRLRKEKGLSQTLLGNLVDLTRVSVGNIESGRHKPSLHLLYNLSLRLEVSLNDLIPSIEELLKNRQGLEIGKWNIETGKSDALDISKELANFLGKTIPHDNVKKKN